MSETSEPDTTLPLLQFQAPRRTKAPEHLADIEPAARADFATRIGVAPLRVKQVAAHYFERLEADPALMTDLPAADRDEIVESVLPPLLQPVQSWQCDNGDTTKQLWRLHDGSLVESVVMRYPERATVCISSQAGCGMNCPFCATGQAGLTRNLSTAEIVDQVVSAARLLANDAAGLEQARLSNVVFMGMGEPLANFAAVTGALRRLTQPPPEGLGLSRRSITVSTVGLVPRMDELADEGIAVTLAVSLHAPDDELRNTLVPVNTRWSVSEVLAAADRYAHKTGRRYSIEYALIRDINDQPWRADLLAKRLRGRLAHVNLIPLNPTPGSKWTASLPDVEHEFVERLEAQGIAVTVRDTRGRDIDGACGQLAAARSNV